jgi:hypothetical protein
MTWNVNDKVVYLPTGERAVIIRKVDDDLFYIRIDSDRSTLPAIADDIGRILEELPSITTEKIIAVDELSLCFQYKMHALDEVNKIPVFIINGMAEDIGYDINFYTNETEPLPLRGRVSAGRVELIQELPVTLLHHSPVYEIDWSYLSTPGIHSCDVQIKPAQFFNKYAEIPALQSRGSVYSLITKMALPGKKQENLKDYSRKAKKSASAKTIEPSWDLRAKAEFDNVLDLHIEKLMPDARRLSSGEKLKMQLARFDSFINQAVRLKVNQVFVIHGIGKGRLKDEINTRLIQDHRVHYFSNDFQERFGHGATEIWLY